MFIYLTTLFLGKPLGLTTCSGHATDQAMARQIIMISHLFCFRVLFFGIASGAGYSKINEGVSFIKLFNFAK